MQLGNESSALTLLKYITFTVQIRLDIGPYLIHRHAYTSVKLNKKLLLITICRASKTIKCF